MEAIRRGVDGVAGSPSGPGLQHAMARLAIALKAGFRPDQPRVPRGNPEGGQWTRGPGYGRVHRVSRRRAGSSVIRIGGRALPITPAQQIRLAHSQAAMQRAIRAVREKEPNWKPSPQAYETVEGLISSNRAIELQARMRIFQRLATGAETGPFARDWLAAPPTNRRLRRQEQEEIDLLGRKWGCHRCGSKDPKSPSGSFIGDHQVPKSMGTPTRIYPHCRTCSSSQGGLIRAHKRRGKKP